MDRLEDQYNLDVSWHSYELRPANAGPLDPAYVEKILAARPRMAAMAERDYGVTINSGRFGFNSRPALTGAKYAEAQGKGTAYHAAVMHAYWQDARDIEDVAVLRDIAVQVGLEADAFEAALSEEIYDEQVSADVNQAFQYGLGGVPATVINQKYLVSGSRTADGLRDVFEKILAE